MNNYLRSTYNDSSQKFMRKILELRYCVAMNTSRQLKRYER